MRHPNGAPVKVQVIAPWRQKLPDSFFGSGRKRRVRIDEGTGWITLEHDGAAAALARGALALALNMANEHDEPSWGPARLRL